MDEDETFYDFSGDDFANDREIQKARQLAAASEKMFNDGIGFVTAAFHAKKSSHKNLKHFVLHQSISKPFVDSSYEGKCGRRDIYFCVITYGRDPYLVGLVNLQKNYPHTIAQPETLGFKIANFFTKQDYDFRHSKKFSRKFQVTTEDRSALDNLLFNKDLDKIAVYSSAEFELNGSQCYFRASRKPVSLEEGEWFVGLAKILLEVF